MKTLAFVTTQIPDLSSGAHVRNFYLLKRLKEMYRVRIYCVVAGSYDLSTYRKEIHHHTRMYPLGNLTGPDLAACVSGRSLPFIEKLRNSLPPIDCEEILHSDVILLSELTGFEIVSRSLKNYLGTVWYDAHNVEYIKFAAEIANKGFPVSALTPLAVPVIRREERKLLHRADRITCCSEPDKAILGSLAPVAKPRLEVLPNGVDCSRFTPIDVPPVPGRILFMGNLGYPPNDDAMDYFLREIFPIIRQQVAGAHMEIIGKNASKRLIRLTDQDMAIQLRGYVDDVREHIAQALVCICPLRSGSGTRLKIMEYMAMGKPVVSTTIGAEGIDRAGDTPLKIADTPVDFARGVADLLTSRTDAARLGERARRFVTEFYDWKTLLATL